MEDIKIMPIELSENTKQWIEWFGRLAEESRNYIHNALGIPADQLGKPEEPKIN